MAEEIYEDRVVLFLDILGFSDLISRGKEDEVLKSLKWQKSLSDQMSATGLFTYSAFSDCIVLSVRLGGEDEIMLVEALARQAALLFLDLLSKGILSRGAIRRGSLYHKDGIVMGPALIKAYQTESQLAVFPRILIDHDVRDFIEKSDEMLSKKIKGQNPGHVQDFDYAHILHVFSNRWRQSTAIVNENLSDYLKYLNYFQNGLRLASQHIQPDDFSISTEKVKAKIGWLVRYFEKEIESAKLSAAQKPD